jgi:hypothetical protein
LINAGIIYAQQLGVADSIRRRSEHDGVCQQCPRELVGAGAYGPKCHLASHHGTRLRHPPTPTRHFQFQQAKAYEGTGGTHLPNDTSYLRHKNHDHHYGYHNVGSNHHHHHHHHYHYYYHYYHHYYISTTTNDPRVCYSDPVSACSQ